MTEIILFGAGKYGEFILRELGENVVECYCDNHPKTAFFCGKRVINYEDLRRCHSKYRVIVAVSNQKYSNEICGQLEKDRIPFQLYTSYREEQRNIKSLSELKENCKDLGFHERYKKEIEYILSREKAQMIPYAFSDKYSLSDIEIKYDEVNLMHYYMYNGKKLYLIRGWSEEVCKQYILEMLIEQDNQSPHCYFSDKHKVTENDTFLDIGSAEGMTALAVVDIARKVYLFECESVWNEALQATFSPYKEKVTIVNKMIGTSINENMCTIDQLFSKVEDPLFVKVDIEGGESAFLSGAMRVLQEKDVKISLCTYHKKNDAEDFSKYLESIGYKIDFSIGYIFAWWDHADFVKGILRAKNY